MSEQENVFTKENLNTYLKELAKEYRKLNGKNMPADIVLIGGAAILANYGFREMTTDIDAVISSASSMKEAINRVGNKYNLPSGWLNSDFMRTDSYSARLIEHSQYYRQFSNVLTIRTVTAEYLIAMKLMSTRPYKNDLSDIVGILAEHQRLEKPVTFDMIQRAVVELYGSVERVSEEIWTMVKDAADHPNAGELYHKYRESEIEAKDLLVDFEQKYPKVLNEENLAAIVARAKKKKEQQR